MNSAVTVDLVSVIMISTAILTPLLAGNIFFIKSLVAKIEKNFETTNGLLVEIGVLKYAVEQIKETRSSRDRLVVEK